MKIINPTEDRISVVIEGDEYVLEPKGGLVGIPRPHAEYWKNRLHSFLVIVEEDMPEIVEEDEKEVEEKVEDEPKEEAPEEAPKEEEKPKAKKRGKKRSKKTK